MPHDHKEQPANMDHGLPSEELLQDLGDLFKIFGDTTRIRIMFALYEGGLLSKQNLIAELKTYRLVDQYLFHTEAALQTLSFTEAKEVTK